MYNCRMDERLCILKEDLKKQEPSVFASKWIIETIPFLFDNDFDAFLLWKHQLADALVIDAKDIIITGSACVGYSLNPGKKYKAFQDSSDVDVGVVSEHYFNVAWYDIRNYPKYKARGKLVNALKEHRDYYIFEGTIAADKVAPVLSFGPQWNKAISNFRMGIPINGRDVKFRIYKDNMAFREYQIRGISKLRDALLGTGE